MTLEDAFKYVEDWENPRYQFPNRVMTTMTRKAYELISSANAQEVINAQEKEKERLRNAKKAQRRYQKMREQRKEAAA